CTVFPACGQMSENAAKVVAVSWTTATGEPLIDITATPPTGVSAGVVDRSIVVDASDDGAVESLMPHAASASNAAAAALFFRNSRRLSSTPCSDIHRLPLMTRRSYPSRVAEFAGARPFTSIFPEPHHRRPYRAQRDRTERDVTVPPCRVVRLLGIPRNRARPQKARVRREHRHGVYRPPRSPRRIGTRVPQVPEPRHRVHGEQDGDTAGDERVRAAGHRVGVGAMQQLIPEHVLGAEQRQHRVAANSMNLQPARVPVAVLDRMSSPRIRVQRYHSRRAERRARPPGGRGRQQRSDEQRSIENHSPSSTQVFGQETTRQPGRPVAPTRRGQRSPRANRSVENVRPAKRAARYSVRIAKSGSTRVARRAGTRLAISAIATRAVAAPTSVSGSLRPIPKSQL